MRSSGSIEQIRREAVLASAREHARLGTKLNHRVEIFDVIEAARIWLLFQPLQHLFGAYERETGVAGIIVNANHPLSLQRFTAAHEYGHHVLGHESTVDDERAITGAGGRQAEIAAHTFSAHFLMPLHFVNAVLKRLGLPEKPSQLAPRQAYHVALEVGASYAAVVNHLVALGKISPENGVRLRRQAPKGIKAELGRGSRPADPWADVWALEGEDTGRLIYPRVNDELIVSLKETPSTGYVWSVDGVGEAGNRGGRTRSRDSDGHVTLVHDEYEAPEGAGSSDRFGGSGTHHFVFRANRPGHHILRLRCMRPWLIGMPPVEMFEIGLEIVQKRTGASDQGVSEGIKRLLAAA